MPTTCMSMDMCMCILCMHILLAYAIVDVYPNIACLCVGIVWDLLVLDSFHGHPLNQLIMCLLSVCRRSWSTFQHGKVPRTVHTQTHNFQTLAHLIVATLHSN